MSNILSDITEDIDIKIKPNKTKFYLKWGIRVSITFIILAFSVGELNILHQNRLKKIELTQVDNNNKINELKIKMEYGFNNVNARIDKVYDDAYKEFIEYQKYNNKQLELILDYGVKNKELIKKMLEINAIEREKIVENNLNKAKSNKTNTNDYNSITKIIDANTKDTMFIVIGGTDFYYKSILNNNKHEIISKTPNQNNPNLFDFIYKNK